MRQCFSIQVESELTIDSNYNFMNPVLKKIIIVSFIMPTTRSEILIYVTEEKDWTYLTDTAHEMPMNRPTKCGYIFKRQEFSFLFENVQTGCGSTHPLIHCAMRALSKGRSL